MQFTAVLVKYFSQTTFVCVLYVIHTHYTVKQTLCNTVKPLYIPLFH